MKSKLFLVLFAAVFVFAASGGDPLIIRADSYASWWHTDETVCFRANRQIPESGRIVVTVTNVIGNVMHTDTISGVDFNRNGWRWQNPPPGYYEAVFRQEGSEEREIVEFYRFRHYKQDRNTKKYSLACDEAVPLTKHPFVVASPTRPVSEIAPVFGMSPHFDRYRDFLPLSRLVGFRSIRLHYLDWAEIEKEKGNFDWKPMDEFMALARKNGYDEADVTLNLMGTPRWASSRPEANWVNTCIYEYATVAPRDMEDWQNFIRTVMRRYPGIRKYELWNEPHLRGFSCFWSDSVENFVALLKAGYETVKAENPRATVWLGGIGMRYLPFYKELLALNGDRCFDVLSLHGGWMQIKPFIRMENQLERQHKPWVSSEWHAMLLRADYPQKSERLLTRSMLCDFLSQVRQGAREVDFFCIVNAAGLEKECLPLLKKVDPGSARHVSGLFRKTPFLAPRYPAAAWHVLSDAVRGELKVCDGYRLGRDGTQCAIHLSSAAGELLIFWNTKDEPAAIDPQLAGIVAGSAICEADGRPVIEQPGMMLEPETYYIARNPDLKRLSSVKARIAEVLLPQEKALPLAHDVHGNYIGGKLFAPGPELLLLHNPEIPWLKPDHLVECEPSAKAGKLAARFAAALDRENFELYVEVRDAVHHPQQKNPWEGDSVQIAFDGTGQGLPGNRIELVMTLDETGKAHVVKTFAASVGGDLPERYTPADVPLSTAAAAGTRQDGITVYRLRLPISELYPCNVPENGTMRFSLLVNNNDGNGRAHYLEWSSGIGSEKSPMDYGDLTVYQKPLSLLDGKVFHAFQTGAPAQIKRIPGGYRVDTAAVGQRQAGGISVKVDGLRPNASYRFSFEARGTARVQALGYANDKRLDLLERTSLSNEWRKFEVVLTIPGEASAVSLSLFDWETPNVFFEIRDLELKPY